VAELERYHNDINQASITEFLGANDRGRGCTPFLPRIGDTCERYKTTGTYVRGGEELVMSVAELEAELAVTRKEMRIVSDELHEVLRTNSRLVAELA
jgi:CCR4-NOT transcription complex subunit 4